MAEEEYLKLLDRAEEQLSPEKTSGERFEKPVPLSSIMGNRTILYNLKEICDRLKRDRSHLVKYLSGELATKGTINRENAIFQGRFETSVLENLVERYVQDFVRCPVCDQPDTKIIRKNRIYFLDCEACGASSSIKGL